MNGYKAFYKGKTIEVYANTSFEAQKIAADMLKVKKRYEVDVFLCETGVDKPLSSLERKQIIHKADF